MATTKKRKSTRKVAVKKPLRKKSSNKKVQMKSFKIAREPYPFMTFRITNQTIYWAVLLILILLLSLWVLNIQISIINLLNEIKASIV